MAALRPVQTRKEIVDSTLLGVAAGVNSVVDLVTTLNDYVGTVGTVETGSVIKGVYLFVQINNNAAVSNVDWLL